MSFGMFCQKLSFGRELDAESFGSCLQDQASLVLQLYRQVGATLSLHALQDVTVNISGQALEAVCGELQLCVVMSCCS